MLEDDVPGVKKLFKLLINLSGLLIIELDSRFIWSDFWSPLELFKFNKFELLLLESTSMLVLTAWLNVSKDGKDVYEEVE